MNPDAKRAFSHYDAYNRPDIYEDYYSSRAFQDRLTTPTTIISILVVIFTILFQTSAHQGRIHTFPSLLWNCLVFIIPARLLYAIDRWSNPPLFPIPMQPVQLRTHAAKSDLLRRMIGLDKPGGILRSVSEVGRRGLTGISSATLGFKSMANHPPGLGNYDNSCYQNSILQSLAALKTLPIYLSAVSAPGDGRPVMSTAEALQTLIADLNDPSNNGKTLWTPGVLKNMSTWQQQDAQEYYSKILDQIDKEVTMASKRSRRLPCFETEPPTDDTSISQHSDDSGYQSISSSRKTWQDARSSRNPLEGLVAQRVACVACGYCEGLSMIPFNSLTLNLGIGREQHDLYERLENFIKVEEIQGVQCAKCSLLKAQRIMKQFLATSTGENDEIQRRLAAVEEVLEEQAFDEDTLKEKCKIQPRKMVESTKTKQTVIARPPQSLAIHMNRSVFDESTGRLFKNMAAVRFPKLLDLGPWCLGSASENTDSKTKPSKGEDVASQDEEQWLLDPIKSMVAGDLRPSKITGPIYELRAVVAHAGQHENGHYVCYRQHAAPLPIVEESTDAKPPKLATEVHDDEILSLDGKEDAGDVAPREEISKGATLSVVKNTARGPGDSGELDVEDQTKTERSAWSLDESTDEWWRLSDHNVCKVDEEEILGHLGQGGVFMLFYDCVDRDTVLVSDVATPQTNSESSSNTDVGGSEPESESDTANSDNEGNGQ